MVIYYSADSGYPLEGNLLTPIQDPQNAHEGAYNVSHKSTRSILKGYNSNDHCFVDKSTLTYFSGVLGS